MQARSGSQASSCTRRRNEKPVAPVTCAGTDTDTGNGTNGTTGSGVPDRSRWWSVVVVVVGGGGGGRWVVVPGRLVVVDRPSAGGLLGSGAHMNQSSRWTGRPSTRQ